MLISELFVDQIRRTKLFEMAFDREKAWMICNGKVFTLTEHILKLILMPESVDVPHWKREIRGRIIEMSEIFLKPRNRKISSSTYVEWLITEPGYKISTLEKIIEEIENDYKVQLNQPTDLLFKYQDTMKQFCSILGNGYTRGAIDTVLDQL